MSEKLSQVRAEYLEKLRKVKLIEAGVDYTDVDIYTKYISAEKPEEIEKEARAIVADIKQQHTATDAHHDKRVWNPFG